MKIVGMVWTHKASAAGAREALANVPVEAALAELRARGIKEAVAISTCNRFELYTALPTGSEEERAALTDVLTELAGVPVVEEAQPRSGLEAVLHLFSVAAGLDSLVVGEAEILGQVKTAYETAKSAGMTGKRLNVLFQRALFVGKKVRTQTPIAVGSSSVPSVAVQLAESIFGKLEGKTALIIGAGAMAELAAEHLVARGIDSLSVANRTWERGYALAARYEGEAVRWEEIPEALASADVVVASTGSPQAVVTRAMVETAIRRRSGRSLFLIDIAMPRDIEESVHDLDGVYLYRLEDLEAIVARNMASRAGAVSSARSIVEKKATEFDAWVKSLETGREISLRHSERPR